MKGRRYSLWLHIAGLGVGIGILILLIYHSGFERFWGVVRGASFWWLGAAVILYAFSWLFRTLRLRQFTRHAGRILKPWYLFKLHVSGFALNILMPAKLGDLAFVGYLKIAGIRFGRAMAIVVQSRILDLLGLLVLAIPALVMLVRQSLTGSKRAPQWIIFSIVFGFLLLSVVIGLVVLDRHLKFYDLLIRWGEARKNRWLRTLFAKIGDAYIGYHEIVTNWRLLGEGVMLSLVIWLFESLTCLGVLLALDRRISLLAVMLGICLANVGKSVPPIPGGLGIYEGILATVLVLFGLPFEVAVAAAIVDDLVKKGFNLLFGIPATAGMGVQIKEVIQMARHAGNNGK